MGMLWGCAENKVSESSLPEETIGASITTESEYEVIFEEQYYRLKRKDGGYSYEILDSSQNTVKSGGLYTKEPHISMLNETTVKVSYQAGIGISTRWTFYYDTVSNEFSPVYYSAFSESGGNVVYRSGSSIIISNIFDETKYYKEFDKFSHPIAKAAEPFIEAEIDESGSMIKISYLTGEDFEKVIEYFDITENGWKGAYKAALETFRQSGDYTESSMFSLCDINGDDTPELFISEDICHAAGVHVYTFDNELTEFGEFGSDGKTLYCTDSGILLSFYMQGGECHSTYYRPEADGLVELAYFYNNSGRSETDVYKLNDVEVSEEEYNSELEKYQGNFISLGRDFQFTDAFLEAALSDKDNWYDVYSDLLYGLENADNSEEQRFSLCDINSDGIPEIFISEGTYRIAHCQIYSYHNGFIGLGEYGTYGEVLFKPNLNLITAGNLHQGYEYSYEYSLGEDFVIVLEKSFYNNMGAAALPEETDYMIDGDPVSAEEYQTEIDKYHDDDSISLGYDYSFNDEDIYEALSNYRSSPSLCKG
jgi:hypothetical protein